MLVYRIKCWIRVILALIRVPFGVNSSILSAEQTVREIKRGKSLIRFGDGEFGIYQGKSIHYQPYSQELKEEFIKIKQSYENSSEDCPYLLAVPKKYMQDTALSLCKKRVVAASWAQARLYFKKNFNLHLSYGDAFLFEKANRNIYGEIWNDDSNRKIIFVHNNADYADYFSKSYKKQVLFVKCESQNAFSKIESLEKEIKRVIIENSLEREQVQLVVSAGPAGKVLVYRFSLEGYHCIDAGHCWDNPLEY